MNDKKMNNHVQDRILSDRGYQAVIQPPSITSSGTGVKHDQDKPILALIPPEALEEEGWVWTFGGKKYGYWNWKKGLVYTRILSAILRHTMSIMKGEDIDAESGKLHAAHIRCCAGMLIAFQKSNRVDLDDRHKNG